MKILATQHPPALDRLVEKAIVYLVQAFIGTGHNPKPVIRHSIRPGLNLHHQNYPPNVVGAASLHDLLEDTDAKLEEIEGKFGVEVAELVAANSYNT